ncbi:MAG: sigma-70 factor domain-containing protein, partial [Beduini sp.]
MAKKQEPVTLEDLKKNILETSKVLGKLTQEDLDAFLTKYDLDDESAEELLTFLTENNIDIVDDSLDELEDADIDLESLEEIDLNLDLDLDSDIDDLATEEGPDLDFVNDFDLMTSDTYNMYTAATDTYDDNQLGSNVKINDPVKMYLKEIGRVELLS